MVIYHRLNKFKLAPLLLLLLLLPAVVSRLPLRHQFTCFCCFAPRSHQAKRRINRVRNSQSKTQYLFVSQINREFHRYHSRSLRLFSSVWCETTISQQSFGLNSNKMISDKFYIYYYLPCAYFAYSRASNSTKKNRWKEKFVRSEMK